MEGDVDKPEQEELIYSFDEFIYQSYICISQYIRVKSAYARDEKEEVEKKHLWMPNSVYMKSLADSHCTIKS